MRHVRPFLATVLVSAVAGCHRDPVRFDTITELSAPTQVGTSPSLAVAPDGAIATAWISAANGGNDGRLNVSVDSAAPVQLVDTLGPVNVRSESPPNLAFASDQQLYGIYVVARDLPERKYPLTALRFIRSSDRGRTWQPPVTVTDDAEFGSHNFHALHVARDGRIYVSWLGGVSGKSAAWVTSSADSGATWSPQVRVDSGTSCPCCRTALATSSDGTLFLAWRHVFPGDVRDVVVARSSDHGATWSDPARVHVDGWVFHGCPEAGPALQVDSGGRVHVAWWTGKEGAAGVWYARSDDGGRTFAAPIALGVAKFSRPAHVRMSVTGSTVVAAWDDGTRQVPAVVVRVSHDGGASFTAQEVVSDPAHGATFPVLATTSHDVALAWTQPGRDAAAAESTMARAMKDPAGHVGIMPVGNATVLLRRGTLQ